MNIRYKSLTIRDATAADSVQLAAWWNSGRIMAHAGFPNGLKTTAEKIASDISNSTGKEKKDNVNYLVQAENIETARRYVVDAFLNTQIDYEINRLVETKILDVFEKK